MKTLLVSTAIMLGSVMPAMAERSPLFEAMNQCSEIYRHSDRSSYEKLNETGEALRKCNYEAGQRVSRNPSGMSYEQFKDAAKEESREGFMARRQDDEDRRHAFRNLAHPEDAPQWGSNHR